MPGPSGRAGSIDQAKDRITAIFQDPRIGGLAATAAVTRVRIQDSLLGDRRGSTVTVAHRDTDGSIVWSYQ